MDLTANIFIAAVFALITPYVVRLLRGLASKDRAIPGPLFSRLTHLWYLRQMFTGDFHLTNVELHNKKGSIVRIAPNYYSLSDPECIKTIYGLGSKYIKSSWYTGWDVSENPAETSVFTERNPKKHAADRRKVANMYSMTTLTAYEPFVDNCIALMRKHLENASSSSSAIDLGHWCQCYAFDVIGEITFGERFGFLNEFEDVKNIISDLDAGSSLSSYIGLYLWFKPVLNRVFQALGILPAAAVLEFANKHVKAANLEKTPLESMDLKSHASMLQKLTHARRANPDNFTDWDVFSHVLANIGAGSDTTAIGLSSILYNTYKSPATLKRLRREIEEANLGDAPVFKDTQQLPYFQAVLKEALRMHPGTGFPLFRVVPEGGAVISGQFFPAKANVGVNSWVMHRNKDIFGADADAFRAERWLEASDDKQKLMNQCYMPFGLGSRTCIGKNISLLEINKLIPVIVRDYDIEILENGDGMKKRNRWFVKPVDFKVRIRKRTDGDEKQGPKIPKS